MSQQEVYEILQKLGGKATAREISRVAFEMFPQYTLHAYVSNRLHKLEKNGYVKHDEHGYWIIVAKYDR